MEEFLQFLISPGMIASYIIVGVGTGILLVLNHFLSKPRFFLTPTPRLYISQISRAVASYLHS